ncbi:MAG: phage tail sheath family protein [Hyphomicrobiaceae bacterium]
MPEYLSPGVYVEEVATGPRPIEGVSTSTAGFVGQTERGPTRRRLVGNWGDFQSWFGGIIDPAQSFMPFAARGFFDNGGQRLFVARIVRADSETASLTVPAGTGQSLIVRAMGPGAWGDRIFLRIQPGTLDDENLPDRRLLRITLLYYRNPPPLPLVNPLESANIADPNRREPDVVENYDNLGVLPAQPDFFIGRITALSRLVEMEWGTSAAQPARPDDTNGFVQLNTVTGEDGNQALTSTEFEGNPSDPPDQRTGLAALADVDTISILSVPDEVNLLAIPDNAQRATLTDAVINQCEILRDRFAVLSLRSGIGDVQDPAFNETRDTSYAALYYPWCRVLDPRTSVTHLIPPSGHVAGIYARTDIERGVHKAPANETVRGIVNRDLNATRRPLEFDFGKRGQDVLNPRGINVIRDFRSDRRDIRVWGARTLSTDPLWRYVNVRRLLLYISESVDEGLQWVVFEPNDEPLWARVQQSVRNFLLLVWRTGALQGLKEQEAFFVRCDRSTMTQADIDAGRLICLIGVAPVKPAEFVIVRISQITATESR